MRKFLDFEEKTVFFSLFFNIVLGFIFVLLFYEHISLIEFMIAGLFFLTMFYMLLVGILDIKEHYKILTEIALGLIAFNLLLITYYFYLEIHIDNIVSNFSCVYLLTSFVIEIITLGIFTKILSHKENKVIILQN